MDLEEGRIFLLYNSELNIFIISFFSFVSFFTKLIDENYRKKAEFFIWSLLTLFIYVQSKNANYDHILFIFCSVFSLRYFFNLKNSSKGFPLVLLHQVLIFFATATESPLEYSILLLISDIAFVFANRVTKKDFHFRLIVDLLLMIGIVDTYYTSSNLAVGSLDLLMSVLPVGLALSNIFTRFIKIEDHYMEDKAISILNVVVTSLLSYKIFIKLLDGVPQSLDNEVGIIIGVFGLVLAISQFTTVFSMRNNNSEKSTFKYLSRIPFLGIIVISLSSNIELIDTFYPLLYCPLYFYQIFTTSDEQAKSSTAVKHLNLLTFCFFLATPLSPYFWSQINMFKGLWVVGLNKQLVFMAILHFISEIYFFARTFRFQNRLESTITRINFDLFTRLVIIGVISLTFIIKK